MWISAAHNSPFRISLYLRAAALAADPGKECEEAEGGPRPRFCFLVAAESKPIEKYDFSYLPHGSEGRKSIQIATENCLM